MIYEAWRHMGRIERYREISKLVIPIITEQSQLRLDKTLTEAYVKGTANPENQQQFQQGMQQMIDRANEVLAKENALRVRQWTIAILEEEERL